MPRMSLHFSMTEAQQADLDQLLKDLQNRRSPQYRKFLTPEQFADRFGLNSDDVAKVVTWLESNGFHDVQAARSRKWVSFSGSAAQAESTFRTSIHSYSLNGETRMANASDPELPVALSGVVDSVGGLHSFQAKPLQVHNSMAPRYTASGGANYLAPDDWETIYDVKPLYAAGLDGSPLGGQTYSIAVVGQSDVQASDLSAFRSAAGLAAKSPTVIVPPGDTDPGVQSASGDEAESDLDLEWAGAIAPNANIAFVIAGSVQDAIQYAIDSAVAPVLSISYGECETSLGQTELNSLNGLYQQAVAVNITVIAASGDSGAAGCDTGSVAKNGESVMFPASSQYVTGIGGTEFNPSSGTTYFASSNNGNGGSAQSYIPEVPWNDGNQDATGGGASQFISKPSWQAGTGVPSDGLRDVPDLAFTASFNVIPSIYCNEGSCTNGFLNSSSKPATTGGTSATASSFAGVVALLIQKSGTSLGLLNPNLYSLATISGNAFHDITAGNNIVICQGGTTGCPATSAGTTGSYGYTAGVGYDQVTGLGSIDASNFVEQWNGDIQLSASPTAMRLGSPANNTSSTATITVTPVKNFSGPVTFSCAMSSNLASTVSCSVPSTTVNTSGSTTVTINEISSGSSFPLRRFWPQIPAAWALLLAMIGLAFAAAKWRVVRARSLYAWGAAALIALTLGAVSCGSGSSASVVALTCTLPEPIVGVKYLGGNCTANGGKAPYTYTIVTGSSGTGSLPTGLSLNSSSGAITGTPTTAGGYTFTIEAADSESTQVTTTQNLVLTVQPPLVKNGYVTVTATSGEIVNTINVPVTTTF